MHEPTINELYCQAQTLHNEIATRLAATIRGAEVRMPTVEEIQAKLKGKRSLDKLSLRDAAKQIGVSPSTLSRIERGQVFDRETGVALCKWLGSAELEAR